MNCMPKKESRIKLVQKTYYEKDALVSAKETNKDGKNHLGQSSSR